MEFMDNIMKMLRWYSGLAVLTAMFILFHEASLQACTGLFSQARDGSVLYARTMEFSMDLHAGAVAIAKGHSYTGTTPSGTAGARWQAKYDILGMNFFGTDLVADGLNAAGLQGGCFYFAHQAKYQEFTPENFGRALAPEEYVTWVLGTCSTVQEVREHYADVAVVNTVNKDMQIVAPLHYLFVDKSGDSLVIEFTAAGAALYRDPVGVFTNNPEFGWHLTNLRNYAGLTPDNVRLRNINGMELRPFGQGTGMFGMPGDTTSPSRFVRGVFKLLTVTPFTDAQDGLNKLIRIVKNFYITKGNVAEDNDGRKTYEYTLYEVYKNLGEFVMYVDTYADVNIRKIDGRRIDFSRAEVQVIDFPDIQSFEDITGRMQIRR